MKMEVILLGLLILGMAGHSSKPEYFALASSSPKPTCGTWCVCKEGLSDAVLQKTLDYACGAGADCNPMRPNGQCYNPNTVRNHCSYAVNSYFQRKGGVGATCDFAGTAIISTTDPSAMGCVYPAGSGAIGTRTGGPITTIPTVSPNTPTSTPVTPVSGTGARTTPTLGNSPTTTTPYSTTPNTGNSNGVLGGAGTGLGPSGSSMDDNNQDKIKIEASVVVAVMILGIICLWN